MGVLVLGIGVGVGDRRGGWREGAVVHFVERNAGVTSPSLNFVEPSPTGTNSTYEEIADDFLFSSR